MIQIGDIITFDYKPPPIPTDSIFRTPSMYYYANLHLRPVDESIKYTVCDGDALHGYHLVQTDDHSVPIGFCLLYFDGLPYIRITQMGFDPEPVDEVHVVGFDPDPPTGYHIGSEVFVCNEKDINIIKHCKTI